MHDTDTDAEANAAVTAEVVVPTDAVSPSEAFLHL
jgi:hypothetical protein